jgi:hypothetical protein
MRVDPQSGLATGVLAQRLMGKQTVVNVVTLVRDTHIAFNSQGARCTTGIDSTGLGGKVFHDMLSDLPGIRQIDFGGRGQKKLTLLTDLKGLIESGKLRFPRAGLWLDLRRQLLGYRLADRGLATDGVMALAVAARVLHRYLQRLTARDPVAFDYWSGRETPDLKGDALRTAIADGKGHLSGLYRGLTDEEFLRGRRPTSTLDGFEGPR